MRYAVLALLATLSIPAIAQNPRVAQTPAVPAAPARFDAAVWPGATSWRHIGPASFGGRIDDIEAVADDPRIIFVGTASGGIFRSRNNGVTWDPVFDAYGTALSIGDIAIAPSDPNVIWAGTGEANSRQSSTWGDGVYRSLDGGTTWQHMGLRETQTIGRIVIDPRDPSVVFVAAAGHLWGPNEQRGLYRTKDAGKTWQRVLGVDENTGAVDVAMDRDGRTLFAATYQRRRRAWGFAGGGPGSALWRSLDGGDTWQRLTNGLPTGNTGRIGIDISKSDPNIVFAVIENKNGGVFRSTDRGTTWTRQNAIDPRPSYYSQIRIDPQHPDHVWLLGTPLYVSNDGGKNFSSDSTYERIHVDHHALWIDPRRPEHMMLGNDGGLYFTYDGARHWEFVDNLPIGQFYDIAIDTRDPYWIYGGAQDNGTWGVPSRTFAKVGITNTDVVNIAYGDGFQAAVDPRDPRVIYANSQSGRAYVVDLETREEKGITPVSPDRKEKYRFNWNTAILLSPNDPNTYYLGGNKLFRTTDRGTTWREISPDLTRNQDWKKLPLGTGVPPRDATMPSRDDGVSDYGTITTISESPKAPGTIFVGTDDGNVQMTTDGGAHWTDLTARLRLPGARWVSKVLASRHRARTAYVTVDGHNDDDMKPYVFETTDDGATWTSIAGDLPDGIVVKTLEEDPRNPNLLFAGTEFGLYWTYDGGRHWHVASGNMPHVIVDRIIINERSNDLVLGTHGRSIIVLDDIAPLEAGDPVASAEEVQLFPIRPATEIYEWRMLPFPGSAKFAAPNPPTGALVSYMLKDAAPVTMAGAAVSPTRTPRSASDSAITADTGRTVKLQVFGPDGALVQEMTGLGGKGIHRVVWDLRYQFKVPPPADEEGWFGTLRAPYVLPGEYTVKLIANGREVSQKVQVRADPRVHATTAALRERIDAGMKIGELNRAFVDGAKLLERIDAEAGRLRAALKESKSSPATAAADSALRDLGTRLDSLRPRFRAQGFGSPMGRAFDLLGALEASSGAPTEAQQRLLDHLTTELRENIEQLNDLASKTMVGVRAKVAAAVSVEMVRPPD
jgi:photosystem II stability/assembly factor-like uncharacterized protein